VEVADLGHEHGRQHRAHPRDGLERQVANVAGQGRGDLPPKHRDLLVVGDQQPPQRGDPQRVGAPKVELVQQPHAGHPEQVAHRHPHALLGKDRVDRRLEAAAQRHQLGPVAHQLA
jgi:hypothetical protein